MRFGLLTLILVATLFGSGYWYNHIDAVCRVPIHYRIGAIDARFGTDVLEVKRVAQRAEAIWEDSLNTELFVYDENASFTINFVFDERQANAELEAELREDLEAKEGMSESVASQYEKLITEFRALKKQYESRVISYESTLKAYNDTVTRWNDRGGAPPQVLESLREEEDTLKTEQETLQSLAKKLNTIVAELNRIGARGNALITDYNTIVEEYNDRFSEAEEFTQGDYTGDAINIYQFDSEDELTIVLAHEFGHALALDHVLNEKSIMYQRMGAQEFSEGVSAEDMAEYERICSQKSFVVRLLRFFGGLV